MTATVENLFFESPAHRALLFGALDRATKRAEESRQGAPTALPAVCAPPIVPEAVAPLWEPPSAFSGIAATKPKGRSVPAAVCTRLDDRVADHGH